MVLGRGLNYANAFEFALKMMETCYVVAERFSSADLLHGPIAMLERVLPMTTSFPDWLEPMAATLKLKAKGAVT